MLSPNYAKFLLALREAEQCQLRAAYVKQRIETGAWKDRVGTVSNCARDLRSCTPLADQEVVALEVESMYAHIDMAERHLNNAKQFLQAALSKG